MSVRRLIRSVAFVRNIKVRTYVALNKLLVTCGFDCESVFSATLSESTCFAFLHASFLRWVDEKVSVACRSDVVFCHLGVLLLRLLLLLLLLLHIVIQHFKFYAANTID